MLGAGSGVSTFAVQLATQAGVRVLVTSSSNGKIDRAVELGAEAGVLYTEGDWPEAIRELTGGRGVDLVLDSVGSTWPDSLRAVCTGGRVVVFGATGGTEVELAVRPFYLRWLSLIGTTMGSPHDFHGLLAMLREGTWQPVIDSVIALDAVEEAHARLEGPDHFGKIVLDVQLNAHVWGGDSAPPVVCLHGISGHGQRFRRLAEERLTGHRVLGLDLRGHGRSGWNPPWDIATHVSDVLETVRRAPGSRKRPGSGTASEAGSWRRSRRRHRSG